MGICIHPDGSMTVGILPEEPKEEKPEVKADKSKKGKAKNKGEE